MAESGVTPDSTRTTRRVRDAYLAGSFAGPAWPFAGVV
jgi:hypothetical protein